MSKNPNDLLSVFRIGPGGIKMARELPSQGPGTGPYQADTQVNYPPGLRIPRVQKPDMLGYGSGPDTIKAEGTAPERAEAFRTIVNREFMRYPGLASHGPPAPALPRYNALYDSLRTRDGWRYVCDGYATGQISTVVNATAVVPVTLSPPIPQFLRTSQFPGGIAYYLVVREFGIAPVTAPTGITANLGFFLDADGSGLAPLGSWLSNAAYTMGGPQVLPTPNTDPGKFQGAIGTLAIICGNLASSNTTYLWQLGFSIAYQLPVPAFRGYESDTLLSAIHSKQDEGVQRRS